MSPKKKGWIALIREAGGAGSAQPSYRQEGPFSDEQVRNKIARGEIKPSDHLWKSGFKKWTPISELPELMTVNSEPESLPAKSQRPGRPLKLAFSAAAVSLLLIVSAWVLSRPRTDLAVEVTSISQPGAVNVAPTISPQPTLTKLVPTVSKVTSAAVLPPPPAESRKYDPNRAFRIDFVQSDDPKRLRLRVSGGFRAGEIIKLRLQARPGDILGRVAHQIDRSWPAAKNNEVELALSSLNLSRGRYNYALFVGSRIWKGTVEVGRFDLNQLKEQQKKNSYFIQSERKKLWSALENLETLQKNKKAKTANVTRDWLRWPEFRELHRSQNSLAFPEAWQDLLSLLNELQKTPGREPAGIKNMSQVSVVRKKLRLDQLEPVSLIDF